MLSRSQGSPGDAPGGFLPPTGAQRRSRGTGGGSVRTPTSSQTAPPLCACGGQEAKRTAPHRDRDIGPSAGKPQFAVKGVSPPLTTLTRPDRTGRSDQTGPLNSELTDDLYDALRQRGKMISTSNTNSLVGGSPPAGCTPGPAPAQAPKGAPALRFGRAGAPRHPARGRLGVRAAPLTPKSDVEGRS